MYNRANAVLGPEMPEIKFKREKLKIAYRKRSFEFVKSYKEYDLYRHKVIRLL